ncbi:MAG: IPT/TIG domain-containing protein [Treponema sp.]|nr:IPT/TIG domain-containing protein [Treponema sp.]
MFSLLFRKSPLFRTILYALIIFGALGVVSVVTKQVKKTPVIESISPAVGSAGDTMTITGSNFGKMRNNSYVELSGGRITASGYVEWDDAKIKIIIPSNVQDGLVNVVTSSGKSKPAFFANESGIPIEAPPDTVSSLPMISSVSPASASVGSSVVITGMNFGSVRGNSLVYFTANREGNSSKNSSEELPSIAANEDEFDYESWTDTEIRVRVPDGAASGTVFVKTDKGVSGNKKLDVKFSAGTKNYSSKKTYSIKLNEDVDSVASKNASSITLRVPRPVVSSSQPEVELNESSPEPLVANFNNTLIHQIELQRADKNKGNAENAQKFKFVQNFVVTLYSVKTNIRAKDVKQYDKNKILFKKFTSPDALVSCDDKDVVEFAKKIVGKEKNPYLQAKLVYDYFVQNCTLLMYQREQTSSPKDLLKETKHGKKNAGDAYDFSVMYASVLRALKIPCVPVAGILVNSDMSSKNHWWNEFYIENFGWVPVDVSIALGLEFSAFKELSDTTAADFYFGNIENQHVAFSRGWNEIKQSLVNGKIVYRPKTFAFQSIWEETSEGRVNYSSLWNNPIVTGIY